METGTMMPAVPAMRRSFAPSGGPPDVERALSISGTVTAALDSMGQCEHVLTEIEDAVNGPVPQPPMNNKVERVQSLGGQTAELDVRLRILLTRLMELNARIRG